MERMNEQPNGESQRRAEDLREFVEIDGGVTYNPELGQMWINDEISADLYYTTVHTRAALNLAREESQSAETVSALEEQLGSLYQAVVSPGAATWSHSS